MTDSAKDCKCSPCKEYRFFLYDPWNGITFWKTEEDRDKAAETTIDSYLDEEWDEEVLGVVAGVVTHHTVEIDRVDKVGQLDEDGYDEAGQYWPGSDYDYRCNYALKPFTTTPKDPPDSEEWLGQSAWRQAELGVRFRLLAIAAELDPPTNQASTTTEPPC